MKREKKKHGATLFFRPSPEYCDVWLRLILSKQRNDIFVLTWCIDTTKVRRFIFITRCAQRIQQRETCTLHATTYLFFFHILPYCVTILSKQRPSNRKRDSVIVRRTYGEHRRISSIDNATQMPDH